MHRSAAAEIRGHAVATLFDLGWHRLKDADVLLRSAGRFDVFVTADCGFEHQHNRTELSFGMCVGTKRESIAHFCRSYIGPLKL